MTKFKSFLVPLIYSFIKYRRASDRWSETYEANLLLFDRHCLTNYSQETELTQEMVDSWCEKRDTEINNSCRTRINVIISFIRYLRERNQTSVMESLIPKMERSTYIPHAFTEDELKKFFRECDNLPLHPATHEVLSRRISVPVFFRLLYSSGIRTNEARMLKTENVDLKYGILDIRYSKGSNQHYIVLHDSMLVLMRQYDVAIKQLCPNRTYFFPARNDSFHTRQWVQTNFRKIWDSVNSSHATAYPFRHHYAVSNINQWVDAGFDFHDKLLYLSKSMGHTTLESTKYYYSIVPSLSQILSEKTAEGFDLIVPEVEVDDDESK